MPSKDTEEVSIEEVQQLQERLEQLRSLQMRCEQGRIDINDRPLLLELVSNLIEEAERDGLESLESVLLEPTAAKDDLTEDGGEVAESDIKEPASKQATR